MYSLLIPFVISLIALSTCFLLKASTGTTIFSGLLGYLAPFFLIGFIYKKKITLVQSELQEAMNLAKKETNRKVQHFQSQRNANFNLLKSQVKEVQKKAFREALESTSRFEPFRKWNVLMGRQIETMKLQFHYQLKEYDQVDALFAKAGILKGPFIFDPMMIAMKMARQYKQNDIVGVEKTYKEHIKWLRGNRGVLVYGLMAWIYVKEKEPEKARQILSKGKDVTGNETLAKNWKRLSNCKDNKFTNVGLGEDWYSLYLEPMPDPKKYKARGNGRSGRNF